MSLGLYTNPFTLAPLRYDIADGGERYFNDVTERINRLAVFLHSAGTLDVRQKQLASQISSVLRDVSVVAEGSTAVALKSIYTQFISPQIESKGIPFHVEETASWDQLEGLTAELEAFNSGSLFPVPDWQGRAEDRPEASKPMTCKEYAEEYSKGDKADFIRVQMAGADTMYTHLVSVRGDNNCFPRSLVMQLLLTAKQFSEENPGKVYPPLQALSENIQHINANWFLAQGIISEKQGQYIKKAKSLLRELSQNNFGDLQNGLQNREGFMLPLIWAVRTLTAQYIIQNQDKSFSGSSIGKFYTENEQLLAMMEGKEPLDADAFKGFIEGKLLSMDAAGGANHDIEDPAMTFLSNLLGVKTTILTIREVAPVSGSYQDKLRHRREEQREINTLFPIVQTVGDPSFPYEINLVRSGGHYYFAIPKIRPSGALRIDQLRSQASSIDDFLIQELKGKGEEPLIPKEGRNIIFQAISKFIKQSNYLADDPDLGRLLTKMITQWATNLAEIYEIPVGAINESIQQTKNTCLSPKLLLFSSSGDVLSKEDEATLKEISLYLMRNNQLDPLHLEQCESLSLKFKGEKEATRSTRVSGPLGDLCDFLSELQRVAGSFFRRGGGQEVAAASPLGEAGPPLIRKEFKSSLDLVVLAYDIEPSQEKMFDSLSKEIDELSNVIKFYLEEFSQEKKEFTDQAVRTILEKMLPFKGKAVYEALWDIFCAILGPVLAEKGLAAIENPKTLPNLSVEGLRAILYRPPSGVVPGSIPKRRDRLAAAGEVGRREAVDLEERLLALREKIETINALFPAPDAAAVPDLEEIELIGGPIREILALLEEALSESMRLEFQKQLDAWKSKVQEAVKNKRFSSAQLDAIFRPQQAKIADELRPTPKAERFDVMRGELERREPIVVEGAETTIANLERCAREVDGLLCGYLATPDGASFANSAGYISEYIRQIQFLPEGQQRAEFQTRLDEWARRAQLSVKDKKITSASFDALFKEGSLSEAFPRELEGPVVRPDPLPFQSPEEPGGVREDQPFDSAGLDPCEQDLQKALAAAQRKKEKGLCSIQ